MSSSERSLSGLRSTDHWKGAISASKRRIFFLMELIDWRPAGHVFWYDVPTVFRWA
jgi:hypothetical protein